MNQTETREGTHYENTPRPHAVGNPLTIVAREEGRGGRMQSRFPSCTDCRKSRLQRGAAVHAQCSRNCATDQCGNKRLRTNGWVRRATAWRRRDDTVDMCTLLVYRIPRYPPHIVSRSSCQSSICVLTFGFCIATTTTIHPRFGPHEEDTDTGHWGWDGRCASPYNCTFRDRFDLIG